MNEGVFHDVGLAGIPDAEEIIVPGISRWPRRWPRPPDASVNGGQRGARPRARRGVRVTADTCPHYVAATEALIGDYDTNAKVNLLRGEADRAAGSRALRTVRSTASRPTTPHHADEKMSSSIWRQTAYRDSRARSRCAIRRWSRRAH